jgi:hypothetical protein
MDGGAEGSPARRGGPRQRRTQASREAPRPGRAALEERAVGGERRSARQGRALAGRSAMGDGKEGAAHVGNILVHVRRVG